MEFVLVYLVPILIMVADFVIEKNPKLKSNTLLSMAISFGKEVFTFFKERKQK